MDKSGSFRVYLAITTEMVEEARKIHDTTPLSTAGLGRVLTGAGLMGLLLKGKEDKLTVQFKGDGPAKQILATANASGCVKGYIANPDADLPLKENGKLDVGGSLGIGELTVIKDLGLKEPYVSSIALVSGEIADDLTAYYYISEQQNSAFALGVKIDTDCSVRCAGGMVIQMLPDFEEAAVDALENMIGKMPPLTSLIEDVMRCSAGKTVSGMTEELLALIFKDMPEKYMPEKLEEKSIEPSLIDRNTIREMLHSAEDWNAIRREKDEKEKAVASTTALYQSAEKAHQQHLEHQPAQTRDALLAIQQEYQERSQRNKLIAANARMQNHQEAVKQLGDKAEALQLVTQEKDDWTAITDATGADGKTLRKIAQCYTLSFLIAHANQEIRKFNSRYELQQVKHSLGIRVIDHDRADDIRDTTSLSGGETFIVSLGLALGLSALSSRNISFENLFIDEGFGTLDPDTLATVIDSLAMLQSSQGKKVGVISHTDTMSERITTQIRIIKNGNSGSSHIEIYP